MRSTVRPALVPLALAVIGALVLAASQPEWVQASRDVGSEGAAALFERIAVKPEAGQLDVFRAGTAWIGVDNMRAAEWLELAARSRNDPGWRDSVFNLGDARFYAGDYNEAAAAFRAILERNPADSDARYNYELSLKFIEDPFPDEQQQRTEPDEGSTDPTVTPTPEPGGFDGPTPTPPREENEPDPTATPAFGGGDFASTDGSTPAPVDSGGLTIEDALRLLDAAARDADPVIPFYSTPRAGGEPGGSDW